MLSSLDTDDSKCEQLNVHASTTASKKRVDFVRDLPWEIVKCYIVPRIFGEGRPIVYLQQPCSYLDVCSTWSKRIISADDRFHFIGVGQSLSDHHRMRLMTIAPLIKSLALSISGVQHIPQLLKCGKLLSLTKLKIHVNGTQEALLQLLEITPNLTHLDIKYDDNEQTPLSLFDVLDRCPRLIRLDFVCYPGSIIDTTYNSELDRIYGNITHLRTRYENLDNRDIFVPLIQRLPNLRLLALIYPSSTGMTTIDQRCPKLQQLLLSYPYVPIAIVDDIKEEEYETPGLRFLSLAGGTYEEDYVTDTMIRHKATLESLELKGGQIPIEDFIDLQNVELKQLKSLSFGDESRHGLLEFIEWVVQHAPNLESVETVDPKAWPHMLNGILRYRPLKRIGLYCASYHQPEEYAFFHHHIQLGAESHLQSLQCTFRHIRKHDSWIYLIPKLTQLKTLELSSRSGFYMSTLDTFIKAVSEGCIGLERLIVKSRVCFSSSEWIHDLSKHRNLQEIIVDTAHIPDHFLTALEAFPHLKLIHLKYDVKNWDSLAKLKDKMPNVVYTEKYYPTF